MSKLCNLYNYSFKRGSVKNIILTKEYLTDQLKMHGTKLIKIWIFILNKSRGYREYYNKIPRSTIIKKNKIQLYLLIPNITSRLIFFRCYQDLVPLKMILKPLNEVDKTDEVEALSTPVTH